MIKKTPRLQMPIKPTIKVVYSISHKEKITLT